MSEDKKNKKPTKEQMDYIKQKLGCSFEEYVKKLRSDTHSEKFARSLRRTLDTVDALATISSADGSYQPIYSEQILQDVNVNPREASTSDIRRWIKSPHEFDQNLRGLSQYLLHGVGQYHRAIHHMNNTKSFKYRIQTPPMSKKVIGNETYQRDWNAFKNFLFKMNVRYNLKKADYLTMIDGASFWFIDETSDTVSLFPIPSDFCYITAPWTYGFRFVLDLVYFDRYAFLTRYLPGLQDAYELFLEKRKDLYRGEELAPFQYFLIPPDKGWCFTFDPVRPDKVPPLTSSMTASLDVLSYRELLKNQAALDLYKLIALKIPVNNETGEMSMTYELATEIIQIIQGTLPDNMRVYGSPFESLPIVTDQTNRFEDLINISNSSFSSSSGFSMIGTDVAKQGSIAQLSTKMDFAYASNHMYAQFNNFINYQVAIRTKNYRFRVEFFGNSLEHEKEIELATNHFRTANTPALDYFAVLGYEPFEIESKLDFEEALGLKNKMLPIMSAFNASDKEGGAPKKQENDLGDAGDKTRNYQSNQKFSLNKCLSCGNELSAKDIVDGAFCSVLCKHQYAMDVLGGG